MDRLRKAARAAGFVMAGIDHEAAEPQLGEQVLIGNRVAPLPVPERQLRIAGPTPARTAATSVWTWIGGFGRSAPA